MHNAAFDSLKRQFADQFEENEGGFLYRHRQRAAAVQVTVSERDELVAQFARTLRRTMWVMFAATMAVLMIPIVLAWRTGELQSHWIYAGAILVIAAFVLQINRAMDAPREQLRHRAVVAASRSDAAVREAWLARTSYLQLLLPTGLFFLAYLNLTRGRDLLTGANLWWTLLLIALVGLMGFQAVRKWRSGRKR